MSEIIKEQNSLIVETREQILKDEHLVTLGAIAAGTAHELGTPLTTITILCKEFEEEYGNLPGVLEKISIINTQIKSCKSSLSNLSLNAGEIRAEGGSSLAIDQLLKKLVEQWQHFDQKVKLKLKFLSNTSIPVIVIDLILEQALNNIIINAVQAAKSEVNIEINWDLETIFIVIEDDGQGIAPEMLPLIGNQCFSTKTEGKGIGLFLTAAIIAKLGGKFHLNNRKDKSGIRVEVILLLDKLKVRYD